MTSNNAFESDRGLDPLWWTQRPNIEGAFEGYERFRTRCSLPDRIEVPRDDAISLLERQEFVVRCSYPSDDLELTH